MGRRDAAEHVRVVVQGLDPVQRPGDDRGLAFEVLEIDESAVSLHVRTGIGRVVPVVTHHPHLAFRYGDVKVADLRDFRGIDVGLVNRGPVNGQFTAGVTADNVVAREPDDTLDQVLFGVVGQEAYERQAVLDPGERSLCLGRGRRLLTG